MNIPTNNSRYLIGNPRFQQIPARIQGLLPTSSNATANFAEVARNYVEAELLHAVNQADINLCDSHLRANVEMSGKRRGIGAISAGVTATKHIGRTTKEPSE